MKVYNICWDIDEDEYDEEENAELNLPTEVEIPDNIVALEDDEAITDWLSDTYGFCIYSWEC